MPESFDIGMVMMSAGMEIRSAPAAVIDFRELATVLGRQRKWIVGITAACVMAALLVALLMAPRFVSQVRILVDPRGLQILPNDLSPGAASGEAAFAILDSQVQLITSTEVLRQVITKLKLADDAEFNASALPTLGETSDTPSDLDPRTWTTLRNLRKRIDVRRPDRTFVIDVSVRTSAAEKSRRIADAIAQSYLDVQAQAQAEMATRTATALESRIGELRQRLADAEKTAESYRTANNLVGAEGRLLSDQQLADLTNQLSAQRVRLVELQARMDAVRKLNRGEFSLDTISEALQSPTIADLRSRYAEAKKSEADSMASLGPLHPAVVAAHAQVNQVRELINAELARIGRSLKTEFERAKAAEAELARQITMARQVSATGRPPLLKLRELENEVNARRAVYETVQRRAKEIREEGSLDRTNARVISPATLPLAEYSVPRSALLAGSLLFGLLAGIFVAAFRNQFDDSVWQPDQLYAQTGLFNLGTFVRQEVLAFSHSDDTTPARAIPGMRGLSDILRAALRKSPGAVLIVGASDAASSAAFAVALAKQARSESARVLLVDGTQSTKLITRQFGLSERAGLAEAQQESLPAPLLEVASPAGIHVLPAGGPALAAERSDSTPSRGLRKFLTNYEMTLIDGGSIDGGDYRDVLECVGVVVIVVDAGRSRGDRIVHSLRTINPHQRRLVATVFQTQSGSRAC
jgi:uncharacterized protein involved in exopolysaccharide biosynthesis